MEQEKSVFTRIIEREIPAHIIYEDDICIVILDAFPAVDGQTLVIPKTPVDYIFNLDNEIYTHIWTVAARVARSLDTALAAARTCVVVEGFEVPHVHIKLYPLPSEKPLGTVLTQTAPLNQENAVLLLNKIKEQVT